MKTLQSKTNQVMFFIAMSLSLLFSPSTLAEDLKELLAQNANGQQTQPPVSAASQVVAAIQEATNVMVATIKSTYQEYRVYLDSLMFQPNAYTPTALAYNTTLANNGDVLQDQVYSEKTSLLPFQYYKTYTINNEKYYKQTGNINDIYLNLATMTDPQVYYSAFGQLCGGDFNWNDGNTGRAPSINKLIKGPTYCKPQLPGQTGDTAIGFLNAESLIGNRTYTSTNATDAKNFIGFLGYADPYLYFSGPTMKALFGKMNNGYVNEYRASIRQYIAYKSIGLDNLFYIYSQHIPQDKLKVDNQSVSVDDYVHTIATRRANDANWYKFISAEAKPSTVLRTIAIQLAEIEAQLDRDNTLHERQLSIAAASEILLSETLQANLQQKRKAALAIKDVSRKNQVSQSTDPSSDLSDLSE